MKKLNAPFLLKYRCPLFGFFDNDSTLEFKKKKKIKNLLRQIKKNKWQSQFQQDTCWIIFLCSPSASFKGEIDISCQTSIRPRHNRTGSGVSRVYLRLGENTRLDVSY